jgi:hypothetical protein
MLFQLNFSKKNRHHQHRLKALQNLKVYHQKTMQKNRHRHQ